MSTTTDPFAFIAPSAAAADRPPLRTPMERAHVRAGASIEEASGWRLARYPDPGAGATWAADVSHDGKVEVRGAPDVLDGLVDGLAPGAAVRDGAAWTLRLTAGRALVLCPAAAVTEVRARLGEAALDVTCLYAAVALGGERVADVVMRSSALDVRPAAFPPGSCMMGSVMRVPAIVLNEGEGDRLALRVLAGWELGEYLWDSLLDAGATVGIRPASAPAGAGEEGGG